MPVKLAPEKYLGIEINLDDPNYSITQLIADLNDLERIYRAMTDGVPNGE